MKSIVIYQKSGDSDGWEEATIQVPHDMVVPSESFMKFADARYGEGRWEYVDHQVLEEKVADSLGKPGEPLTEDEDRVAADLDPLPSGRVEE